MTDSAIANILTLSRNADAMSGKSAAKRCPLKNCRCSSGQPGALAIAKPSAVNSAAVLTRAIETARLPSPGRIRPRRILEPRSSLSVLLEHRHAGVRDPGLLE